MSRERDKATLAGAKGAELLAALKAKLISSKPREQAPPSGQDGVQHRTIEEELAAAPRRRPSPPYQQVKPHEKPKGPKKEVLKVANSRLFRQIMEAAQPVKPQAVAPKATSAGSDLGAEAYQRVKRLHEKVISFTATHRVGAHISHADRELVANRIGSGAAGITAIIDRDDGHFIGYDFGTSTTKAVARHPYNVAAAQFALEVPLTLASGGQAHLWPTILWWDRTADRFSALPAENAVSLDSFKSALIEGQAHRICCGSGITMEEAATAFLTLQVAYVLGTCAERSASFKIAGINFGVPVAALADAAKVHAFQRIVGAALSLVPQASAFSLQDVRRALGQEHEPTIPFSLFTELAGAIAGYCATPRHYVGGHMIVDCGSATLDMASFLLDGTTSKPVGIFDARVEVLGADACQAYIQIGASVEDCRGSCRYQEHLVFSKTLERAQARFMQDEGRYPYQLILIGGGVHSEVHESLFDRMEPAFHRPFHRPQLSLGLQYDEGCEPGRLILADGLARDPIDLRGVTMPGDLPPPRRDCIPEMITKDQV